MNPAVIGTKIAHFPTADFFECRKKGSVLNGTKLRSLIVAVPVAAQSENSTRNVLNLVPFGSVLIKNWSVVVRDPHTP
jgi:hypothetical protein